MSTMKSSQATYTGPATTYPYVSSQISVNYNVTVLWKEGTWVCIEYTVASASDKRRAYVPATAVNITETNIPTFTPTNATRYVVRDATAYGGPSTSQYPTESNLAKGATVSYLGKKEGSFAFIEYTLTGTQKTRAYIIDINLGTALPFKDYSGKDILTSSQVTLLISNRPFYQSAAQTYGIPWQIIAAVHFREYSLIKGGPSNKNGPYQIWGSNYPVGNYTDAQFQTATNDAAQFIKGKAGGRDLSIADNVKKTFFAYNGSAPGYVTQAKNLGFSDAQAANGEGSPYVMNRADARRDPTVEPTKSNNTWGQIIVDNGPIVYPANSIHGAFVLYNVL